MQSALSSGLTPQLNAMLVVGLVTIPGMMTGQVLGGASPVVAAQYQMVILYLICFSSSTVLGTALALTSRSLFDEEHRLCNHRITQRAGPKPKVRPP